MRTVTSNNAEILLIILLIWTAIQLHRKKNLSILIAHKVQFALHKWYFCVSSSWTAILRVVTWGGVSLLYGVALSVRDVASVGWFYVYSLSFCLNTDISF